MRRVLVWHLQLATVSCRVLNANKALHQVHFHSAKYLFICIQYLFDAEIGLQLHDTKKMSDPDSTLPNLKRNKSYHKFIHTTEELDLIKTHEKSQHIFIQKNQNRSRNVIQLDGRLMRKNCMIQIQFGLMTMFTFMVQKCQIEIFTIQSGLMISQHSFLMAFQSTVIVNVQNEE